MNAPVSNPSPVDFELSFNDSPIEGYYFFSLSCAQKKVDRIWVAVGGTEQELELDGFGEWGLAFDSTSLAASRPFLQVKALIGNSYYTCTKVLQGGGAGQPVLLLDGSTNANLVMEGAPRLVSATGSANCQLEIHAGTKLADIRNTSGCTITFRASALFSSENTTKVMIPLIYSGQLNVQPQPTPNSKKSPSKIEATLKDRNGQQTQLRVFFSSEIMFGAGTDSVGDWLDKHIYYWPDKLGGQSRFHLLLKCVNNQLFLELKSSGHPVDIKFLSGNSPVGRLTANNTVDISSFGGVEMDLGTDTYRPGPFVLKLTELKIHHGFAACEGKIQVGNQEHSLGIIILAFAPQASEFKFREFAFRYYDDFLSISSDGKWRLLDRSQMGVIDTV